MKMYRPIVLHDPEALGLWIGGTNLLIEADQFLDPDFATRVHQDLSGAGIQGPNQAVEVVLERLRWARG
jgi:hypothetical protein